MAPKPMILFTAKPVVIQTIMRWMGGFTLSLVVIWGITAIGTENYYSKVWMEPLEQNTPIPGSSFNNRDEAWATTNFGELGLPGIEKLEAPPISRIAIHGDSFIAALEVDDIDKMQTHLQKHLNKDMPKKFQVVMVGRRGEKFADHIFQVPVYEKALAPVALNVIHLYSLEGLYPDFDDQMSLFLSKPEFHFVHYDNEFQEIEAPINFSPIKDLVYRLRLQFFLRLKKSIFQIASLEGLRFSLGNPSIKPKRTAKDLNFWSDSYEAKWVKQGAPIEAWKFAIESLKQRSNAPILFVYAPTTPHMIRGHIIQQNPEAKLARIFQDICEQQGVGFLSMESDFLEFNRETGRFHTGFTKRRPWEGHYNSDGHRLVANAIYHWISTHRDAVHPD